MVPPLHEQDLALIRRAVDRDPEAIDKLVGRLECVSAMVGVCLRRANVRLDENDRRDLIQAVLLSIWKKLDEYRGEARLETWVYRFCFLELRWFLRKRDRVPESIDELEVVPQSAAPPPALDRMDSEKLYQAIRELDGDERVVVSLKHFDALSFTQIGEQLSLSPNTVKTRYYRALLKLKAQFASLMDTSAVEREE